MRVRALHSALLLAAVISAGACDPSYQATAPIAYCSAVAPIAIIVEVRDSVSLAPKADIAGGTVQAGTYVDTLRLDSPSSQLYLRGGQKVGTYVVTVQRPGYHTWTRGGVAATQTGSCGSPIAVTIQALLQPLP